MVDSCVPLEDATLPVKNHIDKIGPVSTMAFVTIVWMIITTVGDILSGRGVKLYIHPSHNVEGAGGTLERLDEALREYKKRVSKV